MLPQEAGSPPTARGARIVFFVSIVALGILSLLMIEAWGLDPSVSCPGAFPPSTSCSARPLWFGLAVIWAAAAAGLVALWIVQARRRHIGYGMRMPPLATLVISIFLLGVGAFALWAGNEVSYSRFPSTLRDALVFAYVTAVLITLPATFLIGPVAAGPEGLWPLGGLCFVPLALVLGAMAVFKPSPTFVFENGIEISLPLWRRILGQRRYYPWSEIRDVYPRSYEVAGS